MTVGSGGAFSNRAQGFVLSLLVLAGQIGGGFKVQLVSCIV